ncbi:PP2C family protein-serine/threonine phosphatase [Streptomyces bluensis]|uniref:PP2C family protein-serine/threonine phosphatase n=1 Tax=Streptomyces bluensis TaxID=33897 RepID=A0ABW6UBN4_9ACTN
MEPVQQSHRPRLQLRLDAELDQVSRQIHAVARAQTRLQRLLEAVLAISGELELPVVLHRIVTTAMDLVGARYGALGVLDEQHECLAQLITAGLTEQERADLAGVGLPRGRGLLGRLIHDPEPLRVADVSAHPLAVGFPPGHPRMRSLLGVAITMRGEIYGDLYLADRRDGQPFDADDESLVLALAGAAGVAIGNARLFDQVRSGAEQFQRLLLPRLPDLRPFTAAAVYRPASAPGRLGGDWYDAVLLPDDACAAVIGGVVGHDLYAAAAMAQIRSMLRALLYDRRTPPSAVLRQLDRTLHAITDNPVTTACLARIEPTEGRWTLHWSSAGHLPPLLVTPDRRARYLYADPGVPLGVDTDQPRPDHSCPLCPGATVIFFTDGLIEHPRRSLDTGLDTLARVAAAHAGLSPGELCQALVDHHPGDGHDDMAVLALRTPPRRPPSSGQGGSNGRRLEGGPADGRTP